MLATVGACTTLREPSRPLNGWEDSFLPAHRWLWTSCGADTVPKQRRQRANAHATLVEDGERVVDEVGYAEVRVRRLHG
jgi:hypothetical protein